MENDPIAFGLGWVGIDGSMKFIAGMDLELFITSVGFSIQSKSGNSLHMLEFHLLL